LSANEAVTALDAQLLVPNDDPVNMPTNEPVNDPVLICRELLTVPAGSPDGNTYDDVIAKEAVDGTNVIEVAAEAVVANEEVVAKEAVAGIKVIEVAADDVVENEAVGGTNVMEVAALAVVANEAVVGINVMEVAAEAVVANDADVILPLNDPVLICCELETVPAGKPDGKTYDAVVAKDAVAGINVIEVAALAVTANDEVAANELLTTPVIPLPLPLNPIDEVMAPVTYKPASI